MKKSVFAIFILVWCTCFAAGHNDELFSRALSERSGNRWQEIWDRFGEKSTQEWDKMYSAWVWQQIEANIDLPDIQRLSYGEVSLQNLYQDWEGAAAAVYDHMVAALPDSAQAQVAQFFENYKIRVHKELETLLLAEERRFLASQAHTDDADLYGQITGKERIEDMFEELASSSDTSFQSLRDVFENIFDAPRSQWDTYTTQALGSRIDWNRLASYQNLENQGAMTSVMTQFAEARNSWFAELKSAILAGKNALDGRAASFLDEMENTLEQTRLAFDQNAQLLQTRMEAIFAQFSTVIEIKEQARENQKKCLDEKNRLANYKVELQKNIENCNSAIAVLDKQIQDNQEEIKLYGRRIILSVSPRSNDYDAYDEARIESYNEAIAALEAEIQGWETEKAKLNKQINAFEGLISQQDEKIRTYTQQAAYWNQTISRCQSRETEIRHSMASIEAEILGAGAVAQDADSDSAVVQSALYLNKVMETVQAKVVDFYSRAFLAEQNATQHLSDLLFSDGSSLALEFVQKMNTSLLRDFALAYYWRSLNNSGFKTIDVAIYSDQNFQKLKSYGYAFSHPENYTTTQAKATYDEIASSPEKLRLYNYFEQSINNGTAKFNISFIGKDVSDVAHDYLWDVSVEKEKNYRNNHAIYNFFARKSSKMRSMRTAMADIDGSQERSAIMETINYISGQLRTKNQYEALAESLIKEDKNYNFNDFLAKCKNYSGITLSENKDLENYFNQLNPDSRRSFLTILSNLSSQVLAEDVTISLGQLNNLDDYGSSSNRLTIMNLTGAELMNMYQALAEYSVKSMAADLSRTYQELGNESSTWDTMTETLLALAKDRWEGMLEQLTTGMKSKIQQEIYKSVTADEELIEDVQSHSTYLAALQMSSVVDNLENQVFAHIEKANQSADRRITDLLEGKGYVRHGTNFKRRVLMGESLLGGLEYENQSIEGYRWFCAPALSLGVNLSPAYIESLDLIRLQALVEQAETAINRYRMVVFGQSDSLDAASWKEFDQEMLSYLRQAEAGFRSSAQYSDYSEIKGLFAMHIGYVPVMSSSNPEKVAKKGYGEYGRIFELFYRNEGRLGRGLASLDIPFYMQSIFDEDIDNDGKKDNRLFRLPSIREGGQIVCSIFSAINPALGVMVNAFDSTTFAALDMIFANKSLEEAAKDVNKRMVTALASWGTGALAHAAQPAQSAATGTRIIQETAVSVAKGYADKIAASVAEGESLDTAVKVDTKMTMGSMVRNWISGRLAGFLGEDRLAAENVASFAGTLTDAGYDLVTTGKVKFNLLKINGHIGILEMNIGGEGPIFEIGTGGYDISKNTVEKALASAYVLKEDNRIRHSSLFAKKNKITMRALFSEGKVQDNIGHLYDLLLSDSVGVKYGELKEALAYTSVDAQGIKNIILNFIPTTSISDQLKMAVVLAHEAYRNGKDDGVMQVLETADAVLGHAKMAYDIVSSGYNYPDITQIKTEVEAIVGNKLKELLINALVNYTYSGDYWKLTGDGNAIWDGHLNLYNEDGTLHYGYQALNEAVFSGADNMTGVSQERLWDIVRKNTLLEKLGVKGDGSYTSKAAEYLLLDGNMSYMEAIDALSGTVGKLFAVPDLFQHYSARIVANNTELFEKYFASPDMLASWSDRNQPLQYLNGVKATLLPDAKSIFHMAPEDKATYKWVFDDGRELVIGERPDGTKYVQTDDRYLGTYNMANPDKPVEHVIKDVLPYSILGNTPDDSSIANFLFSM